MAVSTLKASLVVMLITMLIVIQVESIPQSQEFKSTKLVQPFCDIKCDAECINKNLGPEFDNCVRECRKHC